MKSILPVLTFAVLLTSCSSAYKSGQTPDDVYFSPERPRDEYARVEKENDRMYGNERSYRNDEIALEDRYLRMKVRNRRYGLLDDYDCNCNYGSNYYSYNDYNYSPSRYWFMDNMWWTRSYGLGFYYTPNYYNPYYYTPYYKNPYYNGVVYGNVNPVYNKPRKGNLHVFDGSGNTYNPNMSKGNSRVYGSYSNDNGNYRNSGTNAGGFLRNVFGSGSNSNSSSSNSAPSSVNSGSRGSSSSSGGATRAGIRN